jgi:predicted nucleotidyltransferase
MADIDTRERVNRIALEFAEFLKKKYKLHSVYVYGSYAKGDNDEDSDIDIAIIAEDFTGDLVDDTYNLMRLRRSFDNRIEPHPFSVDEFNVDNPFANEVMKTGIRIM